jgi:hypothetical protein
MCHSCASCRLKKNTQKQSLFPGIRKYPADLLLVASIQGINSERSMAAAVPFSVPDTMKMIMERDKKYYNCRKS